MGKRVMAIQTRVKIIWHNVHSSFSSLDTLLALFAIFVWVVYFTQAFTGLDGFINFIQRATSGDWLNFEPVVGGVWYMYVAYVVYWGGLALGIIVFFRLMYKLLTKYKEAEPIERIEKKLDNLSNEMGGMKKSMDNLAKEIRLERESKNEKNDSS